MSTSLSKNMEKFLDSLYYSEFERYQSSFEREQGYLSDKIDHKGMAKKLSKCLDWKSYKNLRAVVIYLGWEGADDDEYGLNIDEAMETVEGCKKLIKIDRDYHQRMYYKEGY